MNENAFQYGEGNEYLSLDFKQCQRQDGSIYGVKDSSSCSQKGSKEVKSNKGGEGGGNLSNATTKKLAGPASEGSKEAAKAYRDGLDKLGTQALRDRMTNYIGKSQGRSATDSGAALNTDNPKPTQFVITEAFDRVNKIRKGEGKKPITLTSVIDAVDLQRLGIDPNKANTLTKQGKSIKGAIKTSSKRSDASQAT